MQTMNGFLSYYNQIDICLIIKRRIYMDNFENENKPNENSGYGWKEDSPPASKQRDFFRVLIAIVGVALIVSGVFGLLGTAVEVSVTVEESAVANVQDVMVATSNSTLISPPSPLSPDGTVLTTRIPLAFLGIDEISIKAAAAEVMIYGHNSDYLYVTIEMYNDIQYEVIHSGSSVIIDNDDNLSSVFGRSLGRNNLDRIFITVPYSYRGSLATKFAAGRAELFGISGDSISIEMAAGDFMLHDISYDRFHLEMAAGSLKGDNISANNLDILMTAGTVSLSGDLGDTNCKTAAGSISLSYNAMPGSINIEAAAGSADIFLPEDSRFRLIDSSVMGSIASDFQSHADAESVISINMAMGQATIRRK